MYVYTPHWQGVRDYSGTMNEYPSSIIELLQFGFAAGLHTLMTEYPTFHLRYIAGGK